VQVRVGIDTGGTFTDLVRIDRGGIRVHKVRTTPSDPVASIVEGLAALAGDAPTAPITYGSTIATNAVLERKGARVALITTSGFEDILAIGRQTRPELYNLLVSRPPALVDAALTFGLAARMDPEGREIAPIHAERLSELVRNVAGSGAEVVAICLLHAYASPAHEAAVAEQLRAGGLVVSASHEVLPEYREYERATTTAANAYVQPLVDRYLARLEAVLDRRPVTVMQSNGGVISTTVARRQPVRTVLSGPAAGVVGARMVASAAGFERVISFDAGGTSTDVSLIDSAIPTAQETRVGDVPVRLPVIDIHTVGAGGGSIASVDTGGGLRVGPESAGARPGPACYGIGQDLTVTDAHLLLGRLDPDYFLGGRMTLDVERARRAAAATARRLRTSVDDLAEGVIRVANASMLRAIRVVSLERGHDPRRFALVAFGGAGGMHAADLAADLGITTVVVPRHAGVLSALGMLAADVMRDYSVSVRKPANAVSMSNLARRIEPLVSQARSDLRDEGFRGSRVLVERRLDVRYVGQSYELTVPWSSGYGDAFHALHARRFGYADRTRPIEVVALRVRGIGTAARPALPFNPVRRRRTVPARVVKDSRFDGRSRRTAFHRWDELKPGDRGRGAAVIAGAEATVIVPPGFHFFVDGFSNLVLTRGA
jgi:N-methylhydantoinase A/oxoprolinase/acetone carboxylase beta subunit